MLMACDRAIPPYPPIVDFLHEAAPDVLLVSPLVDAASKQVDWIKAARTLGLRTAVCVASWDNLTNKGLLRIEPDLVVVWNDALKREAQEYHYIPEEKIAVTGAQLFDRWFAGRVTRNREEFCARVGLPDTRPFLLFTGSSSFISESHAEAAFVRRWMTALRASADPHAAGPQHPRAPASVQLPRVGSGSGRGPAAASRFSRAGATTRSTPITAPTSSIRSITRRA